MSKIKTGGPAFPGFDYIDQHGKKNPEGMTLRQYAAIKLKVPNSGTEWLDEMITQSLRNDLAAKAMQARINDSKLSPMYSFEDHADRAYKMADAMLKARNGEL